MAKKGKNTYGMYHCDKKTARLMGSLGQYLTWSRR